MSLATPATNVAEVGREGGPVIVGRVTFPGDDSYPTGGTADFTDFIKAAFDDAGIEVLAVIQDGPVAADFRLDYDKANDKLVATVPSTGAQVANAVDMSSTTFECLIVAK